MSSPVSTPSLTSHVVPIEAGAHVVVAHWIADAPVLALGDGNVCILRDGTLSSIAAHPDAGILVAAGAADRVVTGGDDGRVVETRSDGRTTELGIARGGAWIDALAIQADGALAWSAGRTVVARDAKGRERTLTAPSTADRKSVV